MAKTKTPTPPEGGQVTGPAGPPVEVVSDQDATVSAAAPARQVRGSGLGYAAAHAGTAGVSVLGAVGSAYGLGGMAVAGGVAAGGVAAGYVARQIRTGGRGRRGGTRRVAGGARVGRGTGRAGGRGRGTGLTGRRAAAGRALAGGKPRRGLLGGSRPAGKGSRGLSGSRRVAGTRPGGRRGLLGPSGRRSGVGGAGARGRKGLLGAGGKGRRGLLGGSPRTGRKGLLGRAGAGGTGRRAAGLGGRHRAGTRAGRRGNTGTGTGFGKTTRKVGKELGKRLFGRGKERTVRRAGERGQERREPAAKVAETRQQEKQSPRQVPGVPTGRRVRGGTALGGNVGQVNDAAETVVSMMGRADISSARKLDALFADLADTERRLAEAKRQLAARISEEFPADPAISEHVQRSARVQNQIGDGLAELRGHFRRLHGHEWERLDAPRRNEEAWDHLRNQE